MTEKTTRYSFRTGLFVLMAISGVSAAGEAVVSAAPVTTNSANVATVTPPAAECFCLRDRNENFFHGCSEFTLGKTPTIECYSGTASGSAPVEVNAGTPGWERIPAGKGDCNPCPHESRITRGGETIRGNGDDTETTSGASQ